MPLFNVWLQFGEQALVRNLLTISLFNIWPHFGDQALFTILGSSVGKILINDWISRKIPVRRHAQFVGLATTRVDINNCGSFSPTRAEPPPPKNWCPATGWKCHSSPEEFRIKKSLKIDLKGVWISKI
jgi:hypothetical protein